MDTLNPYDGHKAHAYEVEVQRDGKIDWVKIYATNRTQAAHIANTFGYEVRSINFAG